MKKFYFLLVTLAISSLSFGQVEVFNLAGGGAFPTGWTATNNVTTNDIDRGSYFLLDSGDPSDIIVSAVYDLSAYSTAEFSLDVATFGSGDNNSATIEISYDGGTTYTQTETSAVATSSSYIAGGAFAVTPSAQVVIKLTNTGFSGKGNRLKNLVLTAQEPASVCDGATALTIGTQQCGNTSDFGDLFDDSACLGNYDGGDDYIFSYTAINTGDKLDLTITGQLAWTGFAMSQGCPEGGAGTCVGVQTSTSSGALNFESDALIAGEVYYIQISTYPTPQSTDFCLDAVLVPAPSCFAPTDLEVAAVTTTSANLTWTVSASNESAWNIEYGAYGFTQGDGSGTTVAVTANSYAFTVLTANTSYDVYLQADCGAGDTSAWVGPVSFTTLCSTEIPDYTQDFNTLSGICWSEGTGETTPSGTSSAWYSDGFGNVGTSGSAAVNIYGTGSDEWLITPTFDLSSGGYEINLDVALTDYYSTAVDVIGSDDAVYLMQSLDNGVNWTSIYTWDANNSPSNTGDNITVDISSLTSATTKFALFMLEGSTSGGDVSFYVDNFAVRTPPSCLMPPSTSLSVANLTNSSADISWAQGGTETDYEYVFQDAGTGEPTGAGMEVTGATTVTLNTLTAATNYEVYVRSNCDTNGFSAWLGPVTFTTEPDPIVPDYINNFSTYPGLNWSEGTGETTPSGTYSGWMSDGFGNVGSTGSARVEIYSTGGDEWLITPTFDLSSGGYEINLDVALTDYYSTAVDVIGSDDAVYLMQSLDNGVNWTSIYTWDANNSPSNTGDNITVDISSLTSATTKFALFMLEGSTSGGDVSFYVDNFAVRTPPSCLMPPSTSLSVANLTNSSADISWAQGGTETDYEYVFQDAGTGEPTGAGMEVTGATTVTLNTLTAATNYEVYVRSNCDTNGFSAWAGPVTFTTEPDPIVPNYTNDFSSFSDGFWSFGLGGLTSAPNIIPIDSSNWDLYNFGNVSDGSMSAYVNLYSSYNEWLISSPFDLSGGTYYLNLDAAATEYDETFDAIFGTDIFATLMASTDGGSTWNELYRWDADNNPGADGTSMPEIELTGYTASSKFAIYGESANSSQDIDFYVDNFSITATSLGMDAVSKSNFTYFPNPVNNVLSIKAQASIDSITVYNMLGQTVVRSTPNTATTAVDMSGLQTGAYFVQVAINNSIETVRVIKN